MKSGSALVRIIVAAAVLVLLGIGGFYFYGYLELEKSSGKISWEEAQRLFRECQVRGGIQLHSGYTSLSLKNGENVEVTQPRIDSVYTEISKNEKNCGSISFATE